MNPPNIETSTDARSKSRVELAPTMPCKKEEDQRSTREVPLAPELREERQAYVREKWVPPAPEHQLERKNVCTIANRWSSESRAKLDALLSLARAFSWLQEIAGKDRSLFYHWQRGQPPRLCLCTKR